MNCRPSASEKPVLKKMQMVEHQKTYTLFPGKAGEEEWVALSQVIKEGGWNEARISSLQPCPGPLLTVTGSFL